MEARVWNLVETQPLIWGAEWADAQNTVKAMVFGKLVELGRDRIKFYRSDLFHDAVWIQENINGSMQFDWIARESGTFIGDIVSHVKDDEGEKSRRYRFEILLERDYKWILNIYEAGPLTTETWDVLPGKSLQPSQGQDVPNNWSNVPDTVPQPSLDPYMGETGSGYNDGYEPYDDIDYSENEAYQLYKEDYDHYDDPAEDDHLIEDYLRMAETDDHGAPVPVIMNKIISKFIPDDGPIEDVHLVERFCNEDPLPEHVVEALVNTDVNPINWTPEKVEEIVAKYKAEEISVIGDSETFSPYNFQTMKRETISSKFTSLTEEEKREMGDQLTALIDSGNSNILPGFPTLRNETTVQHNVATRKESIVDSILDELREKLDELTTVRDELYDKKSELSDALDIADRNIEAVEEAINSLDFELEDFEFEADINFSS